MDSDDVMELGIEPEKLGKLFVFSFDLAMALSSKIARRLDKNRYGGKIHGKGNGCYIKQYGNKLWFYDKYTDEKWETVSSEELRTNNFAPYVRSEK